METSEDKAVLTALLDRIPDEDVPHWLQTPNPGFGGRKPWNLIQKGERDVVSKMIHQTPLGTFA